MNPTRRTFLKALGAGAAALAVPGCRGANEQDHTAPLPKIGLQLWTIRDAIEIDAAAALGRVADLGYTSVETAFFPEGMTLAQSGQLLRDAGLTVCAAHVEIPVGAHRDAMLELAEAYDCDFMVWHGWPEDERYHTLEGIKRLAEVYNEASAFAKANGLRFALHNHWWEFEPIAEGGLPFYLLRPLIEPEIFFEIDTYWAKVALQDPAQIVSDFGARAPLLHIKDARELSTEGPMVAAGEGVQDFPAIALAGQGSVQWMIVELDSCETDMFDAIAQSYAYLTQSGLAQGA